TGWSPTSTCREQHSCCWWRLLPARNWCDGRTPRRSANATAFTVTATRCWCFDGWPLLGKVGGPLGPEDAIDVRDADRLDRFGRPAAADGAEATEEVDQLIVGQ